MIGIGAFLGAISRYFLSSSLSKILFFGLPVGTLFVNLIGCYLIGVLAAFNLSNKELLTPLIIIGFLGSFTTFSAFTKEILIFSNSNGWVSSYLLALIISSLCVSSTVIGFKMFS
tara:strand:- start:1182 stop:1526 length:345 start_codon:yes stop_codon:yes gene_type:complete